MSQIVVERLNNYQLAANSQDEFAESSNIGARLKAVRKKMRRNQTDFGVIGGVSLNTQRGYEEGTPPTLTYLLRLGEAGIDWYWIVTGHRIEGESLLEEESQLLGAFRLLSPAMKRAILAHVGALGELRDELPKGPDLLDR